MLCERAVICPHCKGNAILTGEYVFIQKDNGRCVWLCTKCGETIRSGDEKEYDLSNINKLPDVLIIGYGDWGDGVKRVKVISGGNSMVGGVKGNDKHT